MTAEITWKFEVGANVKHAYHSQLFGTVIGQVITDSGRLHSQEAAYVVKQGRRRFVINESDCQPA